MYQIEYMKWRSRWAGVYVLKFLNDEPRQHTLTNVRVTMGDH